MGHAGRVEVRDVVRDGPALQTVIRHMALIGQMPVIPLLESTNIGCMKVVLLPL